MQTGRSAMAEVDMEAGSTVRLEASASSPTDVPIKSFSWQRVTSRGDYETIPGPTLDLTLDTEASYVRAELTVLDDLTRASLLTVVFNACIGQGQACGYDGSGCCNGCDRSTELCL
jgi:hypothetical protein